MPAYDRAPSKCIFLILCVMIVPAEARPAIAQDDLTMLRADDSVPPRRMLRTYLLAEAQKAFDARRAAIAKLQGPADILERQRQLRARFVEALGGFPERTPLHARLVGSKSYDGYRLERVIYESRPNHHVTANLYLPEGKPPFPGVLMPIGHSVNGKAADYIQRGAILLARNGIAVLAYDPIGQGERRQLLDPAGKPAVGNSTSEHTLTGVGALLVGRNTASYRIWDGIRSLDYLAGHPEIDPKRLGCTGCSGGGTLTSYLMALDERIVAAAPSCYITSLERLFSTIGPQDAEQNITGQVAFGMEHADYLTLHAPRPTLICAATRDFFNIDGTWTTFREAKHIYGLLGHPERVDLCEFNTTHGFPRPQREAVLRWMRRWLLNVDDAPVETDFAIHPDAELQCTRTGQVLEELKGKSVFDLNVEQDRHLAGARPAPDRDKLVGDMRRLLALQKPSGPIKVEKTGTLARQGYRIEKLIFTTEPGIMVPALAFEPEQATGGPLEIHIDGAGKAGAAAADGPLAQQARSGKRVLALDLRGMGETALGATASKRPSYFGADTFETFVALHLDRPLLGQRVYDLLAVIDQVAKGTKEIHLTGVGTAAPVTLHAAVFEPRITRLTLDGMIVSWASVVRSPVNYNQLAGVVPGVLAHYDLPDLAAALAPRPLTIRAPADPSGLPVVLAALEDAYQTARTAYEQSRAGDKLVLQAFTLAPRGVLESKPEPNRR